MFDFQQKITIDKNLVLPGRVLLAPMHGVMSPFFTQALQELNLAPAAVTPFLCVTEHSIPSCRSLRNSLKHWKHTPEQPRIVQLIGRHPEALAESAYRLAETGYRCINLNFACPAPMVTKNGHGGACLKDPALMARILKEILHVCGENISLSVKVRTGWDSPAETETIAKTIADSGVKLAVVHFRTVREQYDEVTDPLLRLTAFRQAAPDLVLFGNGGIVSVADAVTMCRETGCDGAAAARGIMRNPYLLHDILEGKERETDGRSEFLRTIFRYSLQAKKWRRNGFLECVRLCYGLDSSEFRKYAAMTKEEIGKDMMS